MGLWHIVLEIKETLPVVVRKEKKILINPFLTARDAPDFITR